MVYFNSTRNVWEVDLCYFASAVDLLSLLPIGIQKVDRFLSLMEFVPVALVISFCHKLDQRKLDKETKVSGCVACALWSSLYLGMNYGKAYPIKEPTGLCKKCNTGLDVPIEFDDIFESGLKTDAAGFGWAYLQIHSDHIVDRSNGKVPVTPVTVSSSRLAKFVPAICSFLKS